MSQYGNKVYSNNYRKQKLKITKLYERVTNKKVDFQNKLSKQLIDSYDYIFLEDLEISSMIRETEEYLKTAKAKQARRYNLSDAAFYRFTQMLEYKGKWYGTTVKKVDKYFPSTRLCSYCQTKYPENLLSNIKEWICLNPNCPTHQNLPGIPFKIPRDINASINLLREGLRLSPNINIQSVYPAYTQEYRVSKDLYNNEMKEAKERLQIEKQLIKVDTMKKDAESFINKLNTPKFGK